MPDTKMPNWLWLLVIYPIVFLVFSMVTHQILMREYHFISLADILNEGLLIGPRTIVASFILALAFTLSLYFYKRGGKGKFYAIYAVLNTIFLVASHQLGLILFEKWAGFQPIPLLYADQIMQYPQEIIRFALCETAAFLPIAFMVSHSLKKKSKVRNPYGNAHFASPLEVTRAGFYNDEGIIIGKKNGEFLKVGGYEHVLLFAPTGSGKSSSIGIPNLLSWHHSVVANDPKYELFNKTSGYREKALGHKVFLWAPTRADGKSHRYNPLKFISSDPLKRIGEIQKIAHVIIPNGQGDPIWYQSSREIFLALTLYMLDTPEMSPTFGQMYALSKQLNFNKWLKNKVSKTTLYDPEFYRNAASYLNTAEKTRASILKTFTGYLEIFANPVVNAATSESDFDLRELRKEKTTIYIGFPDNDKAIIAPLLTIFWQQLIAFMTEEEPDKDKEPYDLLALMDEFSSLGRMPNWKDSLKILRSYRVRALIMLQYTAQTLELYSQAEAQAFKNIKTKISYALDSLEDAEYVSKMLGSKTIVARSESQSVGLNSSKSINKSLQAAPLMRPEEIQRLKSNQALIVRTGHPPVMAKQCRWYKERCLKDLIFEPVAVPKTEPIIIPFEHPVVDEELSDEDRELLEQRKEEEQKLEAQTSHLREVEKIKIQSQILADAIVKATQATVIKDS